MNDELEKSFLNVVETENNPVVLSPVIHGLVEIKGAEDKVINVVNKRMITEKNPALQLYFMDTIHPESNNQDVIKIAEKLAAGDGRMPFIPTNSANASTR